MSEMDPNYNPPSTSLNLRDPDDAERAELEARIRDEIKHGRPTILPPSPTIQIIRPGDTVVAIVDPATPLAEVDRQKARWAERVPDVNFVVLGAKHAFVVKRGDTNGD